MVNTKIICVVLLILASIVLTWPYEALAIKEWDEEAFGASKTLYSVSMATPTSGWLVGWDSILGYYNGLSWQNMGFPFSTGDGDRCIFMNSPTDGWIAGTNRFWHWDGVEWTSTEPKNTPSIHYRTSAVHMLNPSYGWAVGWEGSSHVGYTYRWNGFEWEYVATTGTYLRGVFVVNENDVWAVGDSGTIRHWDGVQWNSIFSGTSLDLRSIFMLSPEEGWIVGWRPVPYVESIILHWDGIQWTPMTPPYEHVHLYSVFAVDTNNAWAVGDTGTTSYADGIIFYWDGIEWTTQYRSTSHYSGLHSVFMLDSDEGWAVGTQGTILHWHETDETGPTIDFISQDPPPHDVDYTDLITVNVEATDVSGVEQVLFSYTTDGSIWTNVPMTKVGTNLYSVEVGPFAKDTSVTYEIVAEDNLGNTSTLNTYEFFVVPEFSSLVLPLLFMIATLLTVLVCRRKHSM